MSAHVNRRQILRASLGAAAATAVVAAGTGQAVAAGRGDDFPDVPGMSGDRRANEFWYQLDEATTYGSTQEVKDAYAALNAYLGNMERGLREKWLELVKTPEYPRNFAEFVTPVKEPLQLLSRTQLGVLDAYYEPRGHHRTAQAFGWFGEGVLYDPRGHAPYLVHTMNTVRDEPPPGYHTWYVYMRAMMELGIDTRRWARLAPALAFGWATQTIAKPVHDKVNPPLPRATMRELARTWLVKDVARLDKDFQSFPLPDPAELPDGAGPAEGAS